MLKSTAYVLHQGVIATVTDNCRRHRGEGRAVKMKKRAGLPIAGVIPQNGKDCMLRQFDTGPEDPLPFESFAPSPLSGYYAAFLNTCPCRMISTSVRQVSKKPIQTQPFEIV